jgi:uncharacterized membrane protein
MPFLALKLIHVLAAIVALGSNVTYAVWLSLAGRDRDRIVFAIEGIRRIDRRLANPAYVVLLLTGLWMVATGAYRFGAPGMHWLDVAVALYVVTAIVGIALFAPTIRAQLAEARADPSSADYARLAARSRLLGVATIVVVVAIVTLMVTKPF